MMTTSPTPTPTPPPNTVEREAWERKIAETKRRNAEENPGTAEPLPTEERPVIDKK